MRAVWPAVAVDAVDLLRVETSAKLGAFFNFSSKIIGGGHRMQRGRLTDGRTACMTGKAGTCDRVGTDPFFQELA